MAIDGFELDVPDTAANAGVFGYPAGAREHPAFPKVRVVTIGECGSHAKTAARIGPIGGKGAREQALARRMFGQLQEDWLLIADRGFYSWPGWQAAATSAALLWRVKAGLRLPVLELLPDGSYISLVAKPALHDKARNKLIAAARAGECLDPALAMRVRVIEYEIPGRDGDGELIALITTITDPTLASARETPGQAALAGLREVTEERLQELISGAVKTYDERVEAALAELRRIDPESPALMRDLNAELRELRDRRPILDEDVVNTLRSAARDLRIAMDEAIVNKLYDAGKNLRYLDEGVINRLESAVKSIRRLGDF